MPNGLLTQRGQPTPWYQTTSNGTDFRALYIRRKNAVDAGLIYTPQFSGDMLTWTNNNVTPTVITRVTRLDGTVLYNHQIQPVRVLETVASNSLLQGRTSLFVTPGFEFSRVDALLTNFHLPRSTLLALVMAFVGVAETRRLYELAIAERYRFYSFGDAMLIL